MNNAEIYRCNHCGTEEVSTNMHKVCLFHCQQCHVKFVGYISVCSNCNKFAQKIGKHGCLMCGVGELIKLEEANRNTEKREKK